jgi:hypothetical protein
LIAEVLTAKDVAVSRWRDQRVAQDLLPNNLTCPMQVGSLEVRNGCWEQKNREG